MKNSIIIIIVAIVVIVGGAFLVTKKDADTPQGSTSQTANSDSSKSDAGDSGGVSGTEPASNAVITYSDSGFSPSTITIKAGETVTVKNTSSRTIEFDSDPHPVHTDNRELNEGSIEPGKSGTVTISEAGTWGYHDHLDSSQTGTIVVE